MIPTFRTMFLLILASFSHLAWAAGPSTDGTVQVWKAEALEAPYSHDKTYVYSKSKSFARWVYSAGTEPSFENNQIVVETSKEQKKRAVLISELSLDKLSLKPEKSYKIILKNSYKCESESQEQACKIRLMVRCYGDKTGKGWGVTFEKMQSIELNSPEGVATLEDSTTKGDACNESVHISAEASIEPGNVRYAFKDLQVGFLEL